MPLNEDGPRVAVCLVLVCLLGLGQPGAHSPCPVWIAVVAPFLHDVVDSLCAYGLVGVRIPPCLAARMPPNIPKSILFRFKATKAGRQTSRHAGTQANGQACRPAGRQAGM